MNPRLTLVVLSYSMLVTSLVLVWFLRHPEQETTLYWQDQVREEVQSLVEERYLDPIDEPRAVELFDGAMRGYVRELDLYSRYFTGDERRELEEDTRGAFGGIGIQMRAVGSGVLVTAVRIGGPAEAAALLPGDVIEAADGHPLAGMDQDAMAGRIKGEPETVVELTVRTGEQEPRVVPVTRAMVDLDSVPFVHTFEGDPGVGYLQISGFSEGTGNELGRLLARMKTDGVAAIVLDLRFNAGGVVSGAVNVAGLFLPSGTLVCSTRGRDDARPYETEASDEFEPWLDVPLILLVNEGSASASEILAGALQDHGRAVLVGDRTYGKFLVQTLYPLRTREAVVRITTARYETPRHRSAQRDPGRGLRGGLMPDVRVEMYRTDEVDEREALRIKFANQFDERIWQVLEADRNGPFEPDRQLQVALDLLRGAPVPQERVPARVP